MSGLGGVYKTWISTTWGTADGRWIGLAVSGGLGGDWASNKAEERQSKREKV